MESRNPVFGRSKEFGRGGYATFNTQTPSAAELQDMYSSPSATSVNTGRMTIDDVVMKTATLFGILLVTAAVTFIPIQNKLEATGTLPGWAMPAVFGAMITGLILSLVISFGKTIRPPLMMVYAAIEGVFVGGISAVFNAYYDGIVIQAVLGTLAVFGTMLALYKTGVIRATPKFQKILIIAGAGYLVFGLVNLLLGSVLGVFPSVYEVGGLGLLVSAFGVGLASLFLVLDFDFIEQGIRNGLPERYAWTGAFGLLVTLVWLYIEILRLLAILRGDN
jgi:uncharacterized YccA/Bax inhibitor family protein